MIASYPTLTSSKGSVSVFLLLSHPVHPLINDGNLAM